MSQCNYIVGIEDEKMWNQYNRETVNIIPDTTNMTVDDAYARAYGSIHNLVLGPDYFKPLADIIIRDNNVEYALYWARIFKEHEHRNENDYFINDMKNIIMANATCNNLLLWVLDVCIYDDDIMNLFYHSVLDFITDNYCLSVLAHLHYIGVLRGEDYLKIRESIILSGTDYVCIFINEYNQKYFNYDNGNYHKEKLFTVDDFYDGISDDIKMGIII